MPRGHNEGRHWPEWDSNCQLLGYRMIWATATPKQWANVLNCCLNNAALSLVKFLTPFNVEGFTILISLVLKQRLHVHARVKLFHHCCCDLCGSTLFLHDILYVITNFRGFRVTKYCAKGIWTMCCRETCLIWNVKSIKVENNKKNFVCHLQYNPETKWVSF